MKPRFVHYICDTCGTDFWLAHPLHAVKCPVAGCKSLWLTQTEDWIYSQGRFEEHPVHPDQQEQPEPDEQEPDSDHTLGTYLWD